MFLLTKTSKVLLQPLPSSLSNASEVLNNFGILNSLDIRFKGPFVKPCPTWAGVQTLPGISFGFHLKRMVFNEVADAEYPPTKYPLLL